MFSGLGIVLGLRLGLVRVYVQFRVLVSCSGYNRGDRGWLSHGLVVTLPISYSLDGGTLWGFTRDMRISD